MWASFETSRSRTLSSSARFVSVRWVHVLDELFGELHVVVEIVERDLGFDHPEFDQVAAGLRLLGAKRRPEAVGLAESGGGRLHVELAALREVRLLVEVLGLEERRRTFARARREDGRVGQGEAASVEEITDGCHDLGAHAQDRVLPLRAHPQVTVVHQEVGPVLLRRDRVVDRGVHDLQILRADFVATGAAGLGLDEARDLDRGLLRQLVEGFERLVRTLAAEEHALGRCQCRRGAAEI